MRVTYPSLIPRTTDGEKVVLDKLLQGFNSGTFGGGGGGGGGGTQQVFQDRAPAAPDDPTKPAISFPTGGGGMSEWDVDSQTWI